MQTTNALANQSTPNIKYVVDKSGKGWICDASVKPGSDMRGQGCVPADEWPYDRMFGG